MRKFFKGKKQTEEEKEWLWHNSEKKRSFENFRVIPSSIIHLREIVGVIERFKDNAILFTDNPPKSI